MDSHHILYCFINLNIAAPKKVLKKGRKSQIEQQFSQNRILQDPVRVAMTTAAGSTEE
jgi:hypothetical protein